MSVLYRLHQDQSHGTARSGMWSSPPRPGWQPREAVPARCEGGRAA